MDTTEKNFTVSGDIYEKCVNGDYIRKSKDKLGTLELVGFAEYEIDLKKESDQPEEIRTEEPEKRIELSSDVTKKIEEKINYTFKNKSHCKIAFTHSSLHNSRNFMGNEVYEFIGDRVLDIITTKVICERYDKRSSFLENIKGITPELKKEQLTFETNVDEGDLTDLKQYLVCGERLAQLSDKLGLSEYLLADDKSGDLKNLQSVKENLFEAVIGAVTVDCDWDFTILEKVVKSIHNFDELINEYEKNTVTSRDLVNVYVYNVIENVFLAQDKSAKDKLDRAVNFLQELQQNGYVKNLEYYIQKGENDENGMACWECYCSAVYAEKNVGWIATGQGNSFGIKLHSKVEAKKYAALGVIANIYYMCASIYAKLEDNKN